MLRLITAFVLFCFTSMASAQSPVGRWQSINEESGEAESIVEIWLEGDELMGKIVGLSNSDEPNPLCTECKNERKDQPILGMTIIWGLTKDEDVWNGGYVMDPNNGVTYNCRISLTEAGNLEIRGFVGIAILGRTQTWYRVE